MQHTQRQPAQKYYTHCSSMYSSVNGMSAMAQQLEDNERDAYYGFFTDHKKNEGEIFYNLDEIW